MATNPPDCASVGRIRRPHGVRGEMVVEALTDEPGAIFAPGCRVFRGTVDGELYLAPRTKELQELIIKSMRPFKDGMLLTVDAITEQLPALRAFLPGGVDLHVASDRSPAIRATLHEAERSLLIAVALVMAAVVGMFAGAFLGGWAGVTVTADHLEEAERGVHVPPP